jgi:ABC-type nitrate/sulfonate/bicarbonate transport system ATPase subunit
MNAPMTLAKISATGLSRSFRRADGQSVNALQDVSFEIPAGQFVCLVGPSGCGKSTLLQLVAGLLPPTSGAVRVGGTPITGPGPERGMVFQKDSVFPWMRVIDNVEYGLKCRGVPKSERAAIARDYLARVGLSHVARAWPRELSGGMLKRVAVATVFANGAEVLMLDEPFGALDYVTRHQLHDVLRELWDEGAERSRRRTVLFVTHDVDESLVLADRILVFHSGTLVDDFLVGAPRPRSADSLLLPELVAHRHRLLAHLGLERPRPAAVPA